MRDGIGSCGTSTRQSTPLRGSRCYDPVAGQRSRRAACATREPISLRLQGRDFCVLDKFGNPSKFTPWQSASASGPCGGGSTRITRDQAEGGQRGGSQLGGPPNFVHVHQSVLRLSEAVATPLGRSSAWPIIGIDANVKGFQHAPTACELGQPSSL